MLRQMAPVATCRGRLLRPPVHVSRKDRRSPNGNPRGGSSPRLSNAVSRGPSKDRMDRSPIPPKTAIPYGLRGPCHSSSPPAPSRPVSPSSPSRIGPLSSPRSGGRSGPVGARELVSITFDIALRRDTRAFARLRKRLFDTRRHGRRRRTASQTHLRAPGTSQERSTSAGASAATKEDAPGTEPGGVLSRRKASRTAKSASEEVLRT